MMPADKTTELSRIKLKTSTLQPVSMINEHSSHSIPLPVSFRTWLWWYTCLLLLISMLSNKQAIFESKGDKLSSSVECRFRTQGLRHQIASRLNARWQTDWAIEDQAKNVNSTARPYDQRTFSPLDPTSPGAKMGTWKCLRVQGFMIYPESIGVLKEIKLGCHDGNLGEHFLFAW